MKNNKLICVILALLVCLTLALTVSAADETYTFAVEPTSGSIVKYGETITVTVSVETNPGLIYAAPEVVWDTDVFEYVSHDTSVAKEGWTISARYNKSTKKVVVEMGSFAAITNPTTAFNYEGSGVLATVTLKAIKDADVASAIRLSCDEDDIIDPTYDPANGNFGAEFTVSAGEPAEVKAIGTAHEHTPGAEATCTTNQICTWCEVELAPALGHKWEDATCTTPKTCPVCQATEGEALGHKWEDATCTTPKTCSVCKETEGEALGHKWEDATCTTPKTCPVCKETEGEALGHKWEDATCTTPKTCSVCKETEGEALGHKWEWVIDKVQTLESTGLKHQECSVCHAKQAEGTVIPKDTCAHNMTKTDKVEATCTTDGNEAYYTCSKCNKIYADENGSTETTLDAVKIAALGHTWVDATCTTPKTCSVCKATEGEALGHTEVTVPGKAATCTETGLTDGKKCSVCDTVITEQTEIAAKGHNYGDWTVVKQPGIGAEGEEKRTCPDCGAFESRVLAPTMELGVVIAVAAVAVAAIAVIVILVIKKKKA